MPRGGSSLLAEALAVMVKDVAVEWRTRHGVYTALLFAVLTVVALGLSTAHAGLGPEAQAGVFWIAIIFSGVTGLARGLVLEEETGTADLLRLAGNPYSVLAGKMLFNCLLLFAAEAVLVPLGVLFLQILVIDWLLMLVGLGVGSVGLAVCVTISSALVARADSRGALIAVLSLPVLVPLIGMAVTTTKAALGASDAVQGWHAVLGMSGWALAVGATGFRLFEVIWRE